MAISEPSAAGCSSWASSGSAPHDGWAHATISRSATLQCPRLDAVREFSVRCTRCEGDPIPGSTAPGHSSSDPDFERLERAVAALVERHRCALLENERLRELLEERERRLGIAEEQILTLNQRRQDVAKRVDDLIAQILLLESQLGAAQA